MSKKYSIVIILVNILSFISNQNNNVDLVIISYSIGSYHSCWINSNYNMKCFGFNTNKQLGLGDTTDNKGDNMNEMGSNLTYIDSGTIDDAKFKSVYCGQFHTCSILTNDKAKCWGRNNYGQLGIGSSNTSAIGNTGDSLPFIDFGTTDNIKPVSFALGYDHTCTLFDNKKVKCFGNGGDGQLGYEDLYSIGSDPLDMGNNLPFIYFGKDVNVSSIHSFGGAYHNCIIIDGSQLMRCWGSNRYSQLGYNQTFFHKINFTSETSDTLYLGIESRVLQVSVGSAHTCAIRIDKELRCWGSNIFLSEYYNSIIIGQLGLGTTLTEISVLLTNFTAVKVDSDTKKKVKYVSAGHLHTCVVLDDDVSAKCIGYNSNGQLGQGDSNPRGNSSLDTMDKYSAINLGTGSLKIKSINAGATYTCVVFEDSSVKCFGEGAYGNLGSKSTSDIGTSPLHMGSNLSFVDMFEETLAPTKNPTVSPTNPTKNPTTPTKSPTKPTQSPTKSPTKSSSSKNKPKNICFMTIGILFLFQFFFN